MTRRWLLRSSNEAPGASPTDQQEDLLDRLLHARGLSDPDAAHAFCEPKLSHLHPPADLPGIDAAATRIIRALNNDESIVIYGDYDVDGIAATAILYRLFRAIKPTCRLQTYVPHRLDEGYGLNEEALRSLRSEGADLVITVDCGITAKQPAATARSMGLDLIITDHHNLPPDPLDLPDAVAVVHPRLPGGSYPFGELCGAGVAFKLAWHVATCWSGSERVGEFLQQTLLHLLPLVAMASIADVVPLVDENRVLTTYGLRLIRQTPIEGLAALLEANDLMSDRVDTEKVGFILGPRLNACGRMGHAREAIELFTTADADRAAAIATTLTEQNRRRQQTEREILELATDLAEDKGMTRDDRRIIILAHHAWHPGVVGIVCSRLSEQFGRPSILMQASQNLLKGSARSIDQYSIADALDTCHDLLRTHGGHDMAAGLSLDPANLDEFIERMTAHANAHIPVEHLVPLLRIDCHATLHELTIENVTRVARLAPFGRGNPKPSIRIPDVRVSSTPHQMGANGRHLSVQFDQDDAQGRRSIRGVWWNSGSLSTEFIPGWRYDLVAEPKVSHWNGRTTVELELRDAKHLGGSQRASSTARRAGSTTM